MAQTTMAERAQTAVMPAWRRKIQFTLFLVDLVAIILAIGVALVVRFGVEPAATSRGIPYIVIGLLLGVVWLVAMRVMQCYSTNVLGTGSEEFTRVLRASFVVFGTFAIVSVAFRISLARAFLAIAFPLGLLLLEAGRAGLRRWLASRRRDGLHSEVAVLVGSPAEVRYVAREIEKRPQVGYKVVGVATGSAESYFELADGSSLPEFGDILALSAELTRGAITTVIIAGQTYMSRSDLRELSWRLEDSPVNLVVASSMTDVAGPRIHWRPIEGLPLISVEKPVYSGSKYVLKRGLDLLASCLFVALFSPILLAVAVAIKLDDGGPIFFRQERVGVNGTTFKMTKFRSMVTNAEALLGSLRSEGQDAGNVTLFKRRDDPRVTRVGSIIRKFSLDELPQLFDVVRGNMSLVGPRPPLPSEVEMYEKHVMRRLNVKPGMTGPWQVGGRSNLSWEESVRKDLYYVENWSLAGDMIILVKTLKAVLAREGAY